MDNTQRNKTQHDATGFVEDALQIQDEFMGFQTCQKVEFPDALLPLLSMNLLNIGDAFEDGNFLLNTKEAERHLLDYYAQLWHAPNVNNPGGEDSYWGYISTMGTTEGNLCGLWRARDHLSALHKKPPVLLCSKDTHYSVIKAAKMLQIPLPCDTPEGKSHGDWPQFIPTTKNGQIDIKALSYWADILVNLGYPLIGVFNHGSTFKGAFDPIETICAEVPPFTSSDNCWIHVDAAISGNLTPLLAQRQYPNQLPVFDFRLPQVASIAASPYKWIGAPWPFGIFMTRGSLQPCAPSNPTYVGMPDRTVSSSRNGLACAFAWHYYSTRSQATLLDEAEAVEQLAVYAHEKLTQLSQGESGRGKRFITYDRQLGSPTLYFTCPPDDIRLRFSLPTEHNHDGEISHIVILKHVTQKNVDDLTAALKGWLNNND